MNDCMCSKMIARYKSANKALYFWSWFWVPLSMVYAVWLAVVGYELFKWAGALFLLVLGFGYSFMIVLSLEARSFTRSLSIPNEEPREQPRKDP